MARIEYTAFASTPTPADLSPILWLPLLPVTFRGERDEVILDCLADTGACEIVLPFDLMDGLGARPIGAEGKLTVGDGSEMNVSYGELELSIRLDGTEHRWRSVVGFARDRDEPVLGDAGFFRFFPVTFHRPSRYMLVHSPQNLLSAGSGEQ